MNLMQCPDCGKWFSSKGIGTHRWRIHGEGKDFKPFMNKPAWNKGLTKETSEAVRRKAEAARRVKSELELKLDDDGKLIQRWRNKCVNALAEGVQCLLTFDEFCQLVDSAGLVSSQLGFTGDGYVLARYHDSGNYTVDNCRFILHSENVAEKDFSYQMKSIYCVEDNKVFKCAKDVSKYYGCHLETVYDYAREGKTIRSINKTFRYI